MLLSVLQSVAVVFAIGALGAWVVGKKVLPEQSFQVLTVLAIEIALPCKVFVSLLRGFDPADADWWLFPAAWVGFTVVAALLTRGAVFLFPQSVRREIGMALLYNNAIFFPLVLLVDLYGNDSPQLADLFLFTMFFPAFFYNTRQWFYRKPAGGGDWRKVFTPVMLMTLLALALRGSGWSAMVPGFVVKALDMVGAMSGPLLMLLLGGSVWLHLRYRSQFRIGRDEAVFVLIKNVVFPALALFFVWAVPLPRPLAFMIVLQAAVPPVTALPAIVGLEGGNRHVVSGLLLWSFAASILTVPAALSLFAQVP